MSLATIEHAAADPVACLPFGVPEGETVLYCLPHAGGSASVYRSWAGQLGTIAVAPIQLPGRETRFRVQFRKRGDAVLFADSFDGEVLDAGPLVAAA